MALRFLKPEIYGLSYLIIKDKRDHTTKYGGKGFISEKDTYSNSDLAGRYGEIFGKEFVAKASSISGAPSSDSALHFAAVIDTNKIHFYPLRLVDGEFARVSNLSEFKNFAATFDTAERSLKLVPFLQDTQWTAMLGVIFLASKRNNAVARLSFELEGQSWKSSIELTKP